MSEKFTPFYYWVGLLVHKGKLTMSQGLVLCRVKRWGNAGCWESYAEMAKTLGLSQRQVIRSVLDLIKMGIIERKKQGRQSKRLYFNFQWTGLELLDNISDTMSESTMTPCHNLMTPCHTNISNKDIKEIKDIAAQLLSKREKRKTAADRATEAKRQKELLFK